MNDDRSGRRVYMTSRLGPPGPWWNPGTQIVKLSASSTPPTDMRSGLWNRVPRIVDVRRWSWCAGSLQSRGDPTRMSRQLVARTSLTSLSMVHDGRSVKQPSLMYC